MRRWTDGKCWSASRVSGCFLTYRELEARKKPSSSITGGPTSNLYKAEGLIKQSFSMTTTSGRKLHVISYYTKRDVREGLLRRVSEDPRFVGENGGEWGLEVDEAEYPDPISRAGDLPPGVNPDDLEGSQSPPPSGPSHLEPGAPHSREASFNDRKMHTSPRSFADARLAPVSPGARDPHRLAPHESMSRPTAYGHVKAEPAERLPYPVEVTPLHEARGLLPIRPIPVDSKYAELPLRRSSNDNAPELAPHNPGHLYGRKRSYQDFRASAYDGESDKPMRPRLQRLRSSSMSNDRSSAQDVLAPIRPLGRVGSDDEGVSKLRSTHGGPMGFKEHDSAVGALLSLRSGSGSSDDSIHSSSKVPAFSQSPATTSTTPGSAEGGEEKGVAPFGRATGMGMDRAALDRLSVRI